MWIQLLVVLPALAATDTTKVDVTPLEKIIIMLEDLQTETITEGKAEAKTYDEFACFCKDKTKEKTDAIKSGQDEQASITSDIEDLQAIHKEADEMIAKLEKLIEKVEKEMTEKKDERAKTLAQYQASTADMMGALDALDGAIDVLKGSKPASLIQLRFVVQTVKKATFLADALGVGSPKAIRAVTSFLQQPGVPMEDYSFKSEGIISTLEGLKKDFADTKNQLDAEEVKSVAAYDALKQSSTTKTKNANENLDKTKKSKAATVSEIESKMGELSTVTATLLDDQEYLKELSKTCQAQAETWDKRSQMRADELGALTEAISIIKGTVTKKSGKGETLLVQQRVSLGKALSVASDDSKMQAIEEEAEEADEEAVSFVQLKQPRALLSVLAHSTNGGSTQEEKRTQVVAILRSESKKLKSTLLASLAVQVASDPFAKVKKLIQELIERLLQEAADEGNHKGWCDKETSAAEQARTYKAEEIVELNGRLATSEALRDKLSEEIEVLENEIQELMDELAKATKMREEEKIENAATIKEAEEGQDAVEMAIQVLSKFYSKAKSAKSFTQGPADDMPDSGFKAGEAYTGNQAASGGILGMLDVINSDFKRTIRETTKEEAKAEQDFLEYSRKVKISLTTKTTARDSKSTEHETVLNQIAEDSQGMIDAQQLLDQAITELMELHKACVDTGMSYAERAALREQEIESLKKALCILDTMGPVQTEGCEAS